MNQPVFEKHLLNLDLGDDYLGVWLKNFIQAKRTENISKNTIKFYEFTLKRFGDYTDSVSIKSIRQITPSSIREYLLFLEQEKLNSGGIHAHFRALRTFMLWYWNEIEPDYPNPIKKVKAPKLIQEIIQGVSPEQFNLLLSACNTNRDKLVLYLLMDTGIRGSELCDIQIKDINLIQSSILIRMGKGRKSRYVFIGQKTRKQIRKYMSERDTESLYLLLSRNNERFVFSTLRELLKRLGKIAGITGVTAHDFRRAFCLAQLNAGCDLLSLSRLMGDTSLALLNRYANQSAIDIQRKYKSIIDE